MSRYHSPTPTTPESATPLLVRRRMLASVRAWSEAAGQARAARDEAVERADLVPVARAELARRAGVPEMARLYYYHYCSAPTERERALEHAAHADEHELVGYSRNAPAAQVAAVSAEVAVRLTAAWREADEALLARGADLARRVEASYAADAERRRTAPARAAATRAAKRLAVLAAAVRAAYDRCSYRRCESRWVGGEHTVTVRVGEPAAAGSTSLAWDYPKRHYPGHDSEHVLVVRADWSRTVEARGVAVVREEGALRLVLDCDESRGSLHHVLVVLPSRGVDLRTEWRWAEAVALEAAPAARRLA